MFVHVECPECKRQPPDDSCSGAEFTFDFPEGGPRSATPHELDCPALLAVREKFRRSV